MDQKIKYQIYPSLLDSYSRFKSYNDEESLKNLLDRINKVEQDRPDHVMKGIAFEGCVNLVLDGFVPDMDGHGQYIMGNQTFDPAIISQVAGKLKYCTGVQEYIESVIETPVGLVKLYGIIDYRFPEMIVDLKGRELYNYGDFSKYSQRLCYALISKSNGNPIKAFKYVISDYKNVFVETYIPNEREEAKFIDMVVEFCQFIEHMKGFITDKKIFGEDISKYL
jgi:hypothetical protein